MRMRDLADGLAIPAGATVELAPNGTHVMLSGLAAPIASGRAIPATLRFAKAGTKEVTIKVEQAFGAMTSQAASTVACGCLSLSPVVGMAVLLLRQPEDRIPTREPVAIGGPFSLTDSNGLPFSSVELAGKPYRDLLRLHPLPRRLPDHAGAARPAAPPDRPRRR